MKLMESTKAHIMLSRASGSAMNPVRPLRVLMLGLRGFPNVQGGVETHAENLCASLVKLGCEVTVIVRSPYQRIEVGPIWRNVRFKPIWAPRLKCLEAILHTFLGVLYAALARPDILHIQAIGPSLMTPLARLLGLRVVVTHHGPDYERQKWGVVAKSLLRFGEVCGMRFSHGRIVISDVIRKTVKEKHGLDSVLIPNGVHLPTLPETHAILQAFELEPRRYVLLVSRMVPEKRHHDLIQAFARARLDGWKLVLVGAPDHADAYAQSVIDAACAAPSVVCAGFQTGMALKELYAHAGVFVLPSSHEGLPIALLEALSFGIPVIASDIPANLELFRSNISYFPLGDVEALAGQLRRRANEELESRQSEYLRQFVLDRYKWSDVARKTYDTYSAVARASRALSA